MAGETQELNVDEADGFFLPLLMLLAHAFTVAGYPQLAEVFRAGVKNADSRRYLLALLFPKENAIVGEAPQQLAGLAGFGQFLEVLNLLKQWLPLIKEYGPMALEALKKLKEILDALKAAKPAPGVGETGAPKQPNF